MRFSQFGVEFNLIFCTGPSHAGNTAIEALVKSRVLTFRKAYGIIPLVLRESGFAFSVPFEMTRRFRIDSCCLDVDGNS
jgi:hypothetical protein